MDEDNLALLARLLHERVEKVQRVIPVVEPGRGSQLIELTKLLLDGALAAGETALLDAATSPHVRSARARELIRLRRDVGTIYQWTAPYFSDVGRGGVGLGLLALVDGLIEALLPDGADPVLHLDDRLYMYSTLTPQLALGFYLDFLTLPANLPEPTPVVFNVPLPDTNNALLGPILAHEVGHVAIDRHSLVDAVIQDTGPVHIQDLLNQSIAGTTGNTFDWMQRLRAWLSELMCDSLATVLTGPSILFALACFLPAPRQVLAPGSHPPPPDRIRATLTHLVWLGWGETLEDRVPGLMAWLRELVTAWGIPGPGASAQERFLRGAALMAEPALLRIAQAHVAEILSPTAFADVDVELRAHLEAGIPPAVLAARQPSLWEILLAAWLHVFDMHDDQADALGAAMHEQEFNAFILKSFEMARLASLWRPGQ